MLTLLCLAPLLVQDPAVAPEVAPFHETLTECLVEAPETLYPVTRVVDGDTLWIERDGEREKLRLLSVDTEEKDYGDPNTSESKPTTRYGTEAAGWAQGFFAPRAPSGTTRVGLRFPGGSRRATCTDGCCATSSPRTASTSTCCSCGAD